MEEGGDGMRGRRKSQKLQAHAAIVNTYIAACMCVHACTAGTATHQAQPGRHLPLIISTNQIKDVQVPVWRGVCVCVCACACVCKVISEP